MVKVILTHANPLLRRIFPILVAITCACNDTPKTADVGNEEHPDIPKEFVSDKPSNHRQTAAACDDTRPKLAVVMVRDPAAQPCAEHSDCVDGANGRCSHYPGPGGEFDELYCSYDLCFTDNDCKADEVCRCGEDSHAENSGFKDENRCVASDCKIDADCSTGHWCKASPTDCGDGVIVGYFCTTDEDECRDKDDCDRGECHIPFYDGLNRYICGGADCD